MIQQEIKNFIDKKRQCVTADSYQDFIFKILNFKMREERKMLKAKA